MPRTARAAVGDQCYHVLNRSNAGAPVFRDDAGYRDFVALLERACARQPMRVLGYCVMPDHFHLVLHPHGDGDLGRWMRWLFTAQVRRHHARHGTAGHVWQGRFKAFPVQHDEHLALVLCHVEGNPRRAGLVARAEAWPWSSLAHRAAGPPPAWLDDGPAAPWLAPPAAWVARVNEGLPLAACAAIRRCTTRGAPYGSDAWIAETAVRLGLASTLRPRGRPRKGAAGEAGIAAAEGI
jgi:putative transposase